MAANPRPLRAERTVWPCGSSTVDLGVTNTRAFMGNSIIARRTAGVRLGRPRRRAPRLAPLTFTEFTSKYVNMNSTLVHRDTPGKIILKVADEVWIATASLHREHAERKDFTVQEIIARARSENITDRKRVE